MYVCIINMYQTSLLCKWIKSRNCKWIKEKRTQYKTYNTQKTHASDNEMRGINRSNRQNEKDNEPKRGINDLLCNWVLCEESWYGWLLRRREYTWSLTGGRRRCKQWLDLVMLLKSLLSADSAKSSTVITSRVKPYRWARFKRPLICPTRCAERNPLYEGIAYLIFLITKAWNIQCNSLEGSPWSRSNFIKNILWLGYRSLKRHEHVDIY